MKLTENVNKVYDHYYKYAEIREILEGYAKNYPEYCELDKIGTTLEGRDILILKVTDPSTGSFEDKPAFYVEGNIHAGEITGSMVAMYFLDTVFSNIDSEEIRSILSKYTIYVVPRLSPDGSEYYLTTPDTVRSVNTMYPYSELMPGLQGEDLDGDGVIRLMRVKAPNGVWKISDRDPRLMTKRGADEIEGEFYNVYTEGSIIGYDGVNIKKAPNKHGNDFNRNYPGGWEPETKQRGAGYYPLSNVETKSNAEFLLNHPNVCTVIDMHTSGGQILYTPGSKPRKDCYAQDIAMYKALAEIGHQENGFPVLNVHDEYCNPDDEVTYGGFDDYCHLILGIPAFTIECWDPQRRAGCEEKYPPVRKSDAQQEDEMLKCLKWFDENVEGESFKNWTKFNHPQLGEVEIGGFDYKYTFQNPPVKFLLQELKKHVNFFLRAIKTLPVIDIKDVKLVPLSDKLSRLEVTVLNKGFLPTYVFKEYINNKKVLPITAELENAKVIDGSRKEVIGQLSGFGCTYTYNGSWGIMNVEAEPTQKRVSWIIEKEDDAKIKLTVSGSRIGKKTFEI